MDNHKLFRNCLAILKRDLKKIKSSKSGYYLSTGMVKDALKGLRQSSTFYSVKLK